MRRPLRVEQLEDRRVLATLTVSITSDGIIAENDGNLTLREAIAYVNLTSTPGPADLAHINLSEPFGQNDTIKFASNLADETTTLTQGQLDITQSVTIDATVDGAGPSNVRLGIAIDADDPDDHLPPAEQVRGNGVRIFNITDPSEGQSAHR